jgi:hypothetical protein
MSQPTAGWWLRFGRQFHGLEVEVQFADNRVPEPFASAAVEFHVLRRPVFAERLTLGGQLADEIVQVGVVRVAAGFQTQHGGRILNHPVVVDEELAGARVEEHESGGVRGTLARLACHG